MDRKLENILKDLQTLSAREGFDVYLVGGSVRDCFLARPCCDLDLTTHDAPRLARLFAASVKKRVVPLDDTPGRETFRVPVGKNFYLDFSEMQGNRIEHDLSVRDFTINAMAMPIVNLLAGQRQAIDPHGGVNDLKSKTIRALPGPVLDADPLRAIRAFRFAATLGFDIENGTFKRIVASRAGLQRIAVERISHELLLLLGAPGASPVIRLMQQAGIWEQAIPEIRELNNTTDPDSGKTLWQESIETCEYLEYFVSRPEKLFPEYFPRIDEHIAERQHALLKFAALLHRVKAEDTKTSIAGTVLKRMRFSKVDGRFIDKVITTQKAALTFALRFSGSQDNDASRIYALVKKAGGELIPALLLAAAIHTARAKKRLRNGDKFMQAINALSGFLFERYLPAQVSPVLLTGDDLAHRLKLPPSPLFKIILDHVEKARVLGAVKTRKEAEAMARNLIRTL